MTAFPTGSGGGEIPEIPSTVYCEVDDRARPIRAYGLITMSPGGGGCRVFLNAAGEPLARLCYRRDQAEQYALGQGLNYIIGASNSYHAGHLVARHLGGPQGRDNLVVMHATYNSGICYSDAGYAFWEGVFDSYLEEMVRDEATRPEPGELFALEIRAQYGPTSTEPLIKWDVWTAARQEAWAVRSEVHRDRWAASGYEGRDPDADPQRLARPEDREEDWQMVLDFCAYLQKMATRIPSAIEFSIQTFQMGGAGQAAWFPMPLTEHFAGKDIGEIGLPAEGTGGAALLAKAEENSLSELPSYIYSAETFGEALRRWDRVGRPTGEVYRHRRMNFEVAHRKALLDDFYQHFFADRIPAPWEHGLGYAPEDIGEGGFDEEHPLPVPPSTLDRELEQLERDDNHIVDAARQIAHRVTRSGGGF